jgi:hypothetical protein
MAMALFAVATDSMKQPTTLPPRTATAPPSFLPASPSFAGHQTFALRSGWLKKGYDALRTHGPDVFSRPNALAILGVGKNMVTSIRHYLVATGVARETREGNRAAGLMPTAFGDALFADTGYDPYLEAAATLYLLHWRLAGPGSALYTWAYMFSLFRAVEFSRDSLAEAVLRSASSLSRVPSKETVARDVDCLLHTYSSAPTTGSTVREEDLDSLDSPLRSLGLIRPAFDRTFRMMVGPRHSLTPEVFTFTLVEYWERMHPRATTLPLQDVAYREGAPGMVFKLGEEDVYTYLDQIEEQSEGLLRLDDTAQVRQVVRARPITPADSVRLLAYCYR